MIEEQLKGVPIFLDTEVKKFEGLNPPTDNDKSSEILVLHFSLEGGEIDTFLASSRVAEKNCWVEAKYLGLLTNRENLNLVAFGLSKFKKCYAMKYRYFFRCEKIFYETFYAGGCYRSVNFFQNISKDFFREIKI